MSYLTAEAKAKLSSTIRILRDRLLTDFHNAVESAYPPLFRCSTKSNVRD
jgi:hypothetical protein